MTRAASPGIPPQGPPPAGIEPTRWAGATPQNGVARSQPALPFSGWAGAQHNGASTFAPRYSSGGYMFDAGGVQIGRDPRGVIQQTYGGTPQAMAAAQRRDRLTAPSGGSSYQDSQDRLSTLYNR